MEFERLLGKDSPLLKSVRSRGFEVPSEIQEKSIPLILEGKDIIAGASTGSGKTLAFAAGLIKNIQKDYGIQGLVLTPTRELAEQISSELSDFSKHKDLDVISVYGGVAINPQMKRLAVADIVVGTPGRILDHIERNSINLTRINTLVLDEADRMLDMGFREDVEKIISKCSKERQTMLFSATISQDISRLAQKHLNKPIEISAKPHVDPSKLEQVYYDVEDGLKYSLLKYLVENEKSDLVMIFCNTRRNVDFVANNLQLSGIEAVPIHGGFTQDKRTRIIEKFHSKKVHVLVATDVAARGLDIKEVSHIYNYDIPPSKDEYIHRIGRTARAGEEGKVINILTSRGYDNFHNLITDEFKIVRKDAPYLKRAEIKWMPDRNDRSDGRRGYSNQRGPRRDSRGGPSRGPRRDSIGGPRRDSRGGPSRGPRRDSRSGPSRGPRRDSGRSYSNQGGSRDSNRGPRSDSDNRFNRGSRDRGPDNRGPKRDSRDRRPDNRRSNKRGFDERGSRDEISNDRRPDNREQRFSNNSGFRRTFH